MASRPSLRLVSSYSLCSRVQRQLLLRPEQGRLCLRVQLANLLCLGAVCQASAQPGSAPHPPTKGCSPPTDSGRWSEAAPWGSMVSCTPSWFWGPVVILEDCLAAFFAADELKGEWIGREWGWGAGSAYGSRFRDALSASHPCLWTGSGTAHSGSPTSLKLLGVPLFSFLYLFGGQIG